MSGRPCVTCSRLIRSRRKLDCYAIISLFKDLFGQLRLVIPRKKPLLLEFSLQ